MEDLKKLQKPTEPAAIFVAAVFNLTTVSQNEIEEQVNIVKQMMSHMQYDKYLPYPEITNYSFYNSESIDKNNLELILYEYFNGGEFPKKFIRHVELAIAQKDFFSNQLEVIKTELDELVDIKGKLYSEFIAILGIFSALIFGLLGSLSVFGELGSSLRETPLYKMFIYIGLTSIAITLISFLSYNAIAKISNLKLRSCGCKGNECKHNPVQKHPTIFVMIFVYLSSIATGIIITLITKPINFIKFNIFGISVNSLGIQLFMLIVVVAIPIVYIILLFKYYFSVKTRKRNKQ